MAPDDVTFRVMVEADIPAGLGLCRASHWNQVERDWRFFLTWDPRGSLVAVRDGRVIGTVVTVRYGDAASGAVPEATRMTSARPRFAWVAMMLVDPAERGRGVGRALLTRGLALLDDVETVRLDATPAGEPLYRTLGFVEESRFTRLQRPAGLAAPALAEALRPGNEGAVEVRSVDATAAEWEAPRAGDGRSVRVRPLQAADWDAIAAHDARAFAADRHAMLEWLSDGAPEYAWVATADARIVGYVFGRRGYNFDHIGPVIADSVGTAARLVSACLAAHPDRAGRVDRPASAGRACILDAPLDQPAWRRWLAGAGFVEQRPFLRMSRGQPPPAGDPAALFATLGPEFG